jgi:MFS family permease
VATLPRRPAVSVSRLAVLDALRDPQYRLIWLAGFCVNTGRWMDFVVLGWVVLELTNSPAMVGVAAFCRMAPMMALGLFAGVLADRVNRGHLMVAVQVLNLSSALVLAVFFGTGVGQLWQLIVLQLVLGTAWAIDFPARRTVLYTLVGRGRIANAISLESVSMQGTKMIGPLVGGLLLARAGPAGCYLLLATLYTVSLVLVLTLHRRVNLPAGASAESVLASLATGFREVRAVPTIMAVLTITVLMNLLVFPYQQMLPVIARDVLLVGPELLGLLVAADGLGALTGALAVATRREMTAHRQIFAGGSLMAATLLIGFAFSPWFWLSLPLQFFIGVAESGFGTMQSTIVLLSAPDAARGRIMGILSVCIGAGPLGALWIGFAAGQFGAPIAVATGGAVALVTMAPIAVRMLGRRTADAGPRTLAAATSSAVRRHSPGA